MWESLLPHLKILQMDGMAGHLVHLQWILHMIKHHSDTGSSGDLSTMNIDLPSEHSSSPPPTDSAHVQCHCDVEFDGHREGIVQEIVECFQCHRYTHLACLTSQL